MALVMSLTLFMAIGGPLIWWFFVRVLSTPPTSTVARGARKVGSRLGLVILLGAGVVLLLASVQSTANTVATVAWAAGGILTVWSVSSTRWSLPSLARARALRVLDNARADAQSGNPAAMHLLGTGLMFDGDLPAARPWLERAAKAGVRDAQWDLARLLDRTDGPRAARPWFEAAAKAGHSGAMALITGKQQSISSWAAPWLSASPIAPGPGPEPPQGARTSS
jgi:hypothetical protein